MSTVVEVVASTVPSFFTPAFAALATGFLGPVFVAAGRVTRALSTIFVVADLAAAAAAVTWGGFRAGTVAGAETGRAAGADPPGGEAGADGSEGAADAPGTAGAATAGTAGATAPAVSPMPAYAA